jgi:hypothetical protein
MIVEAQNRYDLTIKVAEVISPCKPHYTEEIAIGLSSCRGVDSLQKRKREG